MGRKWSLSIGLALSYCRREYQKHLSIPHPVRAKTLFSDYLVLLFGFVWCFPYRRLDRWAPMFLPVTDIWNAGTLFLPALQRALQN